MSGGFELARTSATSKSIVWTQPEIRDFAPVLEGARST